MEIENKNYKKCCICGELFKTKPSHWERRKTCGKKCDHKRRETMYLGANNPNFNNKGEKNPIFKGKRINRGGYILIYHPEHPNCDQEGYILEHRYVMSKYLGRALESWEIVHHKDHNRKNNDLSNLEVMSLSDHTKMHNKEKEIVRCEKTGRIIKIKKLNLGVIELDDRSK